MALPWSFRYNGFVRQVFARRLQGAWESDVQEQRGGSISGIGNGEPVIRYRMWKPALLVLRRVLLPLFLVWVLNDIVFWTPPTGGPAHDVSQFSGIWEVWSLQFAILCHRGTRTSLSVKLLIYSSCQRN